MTMALAPRMARFKASESNLAGDRARALRQAGHHVVDFSIGEPDFAVPEHVKQALVEALARDDTHYTNTGGTPATLDAVRAKFARENQLQYERNEVMVATGAKSVMYHAFACTVSEGDEVIVPRPYWISYPNQVRICGGTPVFVDCPADRGFGLDVEAIERAITPRTRWLVLNSPNNPTGGVMARAQLQQLAEVLLRHPAVLVMSDEIYEHLRYGNAEHHSLAAVEPRLKDRTLVVNGVSKAYAMTGLRIGYAGGSAELIGAMVKLQTQTTSCACSLSQAAAAAALGGPQDVVAERLATMSRRREHLHAELSKVPLLRVNPPDGAMYYFCDARQAMGRRTPSGKVLETDADLAGYLLDEYKVVVVQGAAYGQPGFFRISFATSIENLSEGCRRLREAFAALT
ncbi:MAG: pyridoxal phosphate-dependent aminotransferase [Burkholderiaceae bacterium]